MLATPWEDEATTASYHDALAAHAGQAELAATLLHFGYLLLLPAALGIMHLARRSTPSSRTSAGCSPLWASPPCPACSSRTSTTLLWRRRCRASQSVAIADDAASAGP